MNNIIIKLHVASVATETVVKTITIIIRDCMFSKLNDTKTKTIIRALAA